MKLWFTKRIKFGPNRKFKIVLRNSHLNVFLRDSGALLKKMQRCNLK